jgi:CRP-like cAMP-binding protein
MEGDIAKLGEGDFFGEIALLKGGFRTAGVRLAHSTSAFSLACSYLTRAISVLRYAHDLDAFEGFGELFWLPTKAVRGLLKAHPEMEAAWRLRLQHYTLIQERHEHDAQYVAAPEQSQRLLARQKTGISGSQNWNGPQFNFAAMHREDTVSNRLKQYVRRTSFLSKARAVDKGTEQQSPEGTAPTSGHHGLHYENAVTDQFSHALDIAFNAPK